jgi:hypothetical protein
MSPTAPTLNPTSPIRAHDVALADDWCASFTAEVISRLPQEAFCFGKRRT